MMTAKFFELWLLRRVCVCAGTQNKWFFWGFIRGSMVEGFHFAAQCRRKMAL